MKITKEEALALTKVLHQHGVGSNGFLAEEAKTEHQHTLEDLAERLDEFLVYGGGDEDDCDEDCCEEDDDEEAEDDDGEEEEDSTEKDEEVDEEDDSDEEGDSEDDESDESDDLECDYECTASELHELKPVKSKAGSIEFEDVTEDDNDELVHLLFDGYAEFAITHLRRTGTELHVRDNDGDWHVYQVSRFPKEWSTFFPLNELVEVIEA